MLEERNGQASGRVGFIDFGIVGRVSPGTWMAVEALLTSVATRDFDTMARALVTVGATSTDVDIKVLSIVHASRNDSLLVKLSKLSLSLAAPV